MFRPTDDRFCSLRNEKIDLIKKQIIDLFNKSEGQARANAIVLHSKTYQKVVRDTPLERLMLETDAPWLHPTLDRDKRNDPTHVLEVAEKIAEIKRISVEDVIDTTSRNAVEFYDLKLRCE